MEAPHKHGWIIWAVLAGVVIIGGVIYYIESNKSKSKSKPPPQPIVPTAPTASTFPIQYGTSGQIIKNLQSGLAQYDNVNISITGTFDAQTLTALGVAGFKSPVSQSDYSEIIAPPNASNTDTSSAAWSEANGDIPTTASQASAVLLDPNATTAQISAAESINAIMLGGGQPGQSYI